MKKLLSVFIALALLLSIGAAAFASGEPSGGSGEAPASGTVLTATADYPDGITLKADNEFTAEPGYCVIMTVDGVVMSQKAGEYKGHVVFEVIPQTSSKDSSAEFSTNSILTKDGEVLYTADSALNGTYDENGISGANITADSPNVSVVTVVNGTYRIDDSTFHILQTGNHASGGNDFTGDGCAVAVTGDSTVFLKNVDITGDGITRTALFGGLSTRDAYPTIYVTDCVLNSTGDPEGEDCAVWVLGLHGVVRTCQFCDYYDNYYLNTEIHSFGWADLSVDGTEYPTEEDLAELNAAYVDGRGYADASGEIMPLDEFAVAATGLTDEYLAQLAAVKTEEDMVALPNTNDTSLYYFAGKNTLIDSDLVISDMDQGRTGYSSYSIGANINVYSNCRVEADYGNVEANEYASSAYVNGTEVNARKSVVMCHSNAGGITFVSDADLTAGEVAFIYKGTGDGYTQDNLDENAASAEMMMGATGSNLFVRNSKITAPVLVLAFDSDDPGGLGTAVIELDDSIAPKDEGFDVTNADRWGPASTMWKEGHYAYNEAVQAYFQDCRGETALEGDIFNCHQFVSKNLVLTLDNSELTGVISSGWCEHDVDIINREMGAFDEDYVDPADGLRHGNRENLGQVTCYPAETVNNGVIVSLVNGAVWNVTETSYVSVLNVDETSSVNGVVTVLGDGLIRVDPAASGEAAPAAEDAAPATDGTENQSNILAGSAEPATEEEYEAYEAYLRDYMTNYSGVGDGTFDDGARSMALGELDGVGFGADVNAFPFEMYVTQFGAMDFASWAASR